MLISSDSNLDRQIDFKRLFLSYDGEILLSTAEKSDI